MRLLLHFVVTRLLLKEVINFFVLYKYRIDKDGMTGGHYQRFHIELIHDQLPLAVPCYDLLPVTESTLVLD